jgi:medium-chain acyl-[acyl-carrier-protein] hydrolase
MTTVEDVTRRWLPLKPRTGTDAVRLFCLPHAGGGASAFRTWQERLPGVAVLPLQPPGRESRFRETPYDRMAPLVDELATVVLAAAGSRPYAVYGHSLGGLVAFELLREVRRRGGPEPVHLFVSGCVAPHCRYDDGPLVGGMTRAEVVHMLRNLGGTPDWLFNDPSALDMVLPAVLADFSVKETYVYVAQPPLRVPVTVVSSTADPRVPHDLQARWKEQTVGEFTLYALSGGHFAVFEQAAKTHRYLADALRPWS